VPQPVGQSVHSLLIIARPHPLLRVKVGNVAKLQPGTQPPLFGLAQLPDQRHFQLAKVPAECALLLVGQRLVAKHQNRVAVHTSLDCGDFTLRQRGADIDTGYRADEQGVVLTDSNAHERFLLLPC
jgi:hypothetical protein